MSDEGNVERRTRINLMLDDGDLGLLIEQSQKEKLSKSEVIRRALRMYCGALGQNLQAVG